MTRCSFVIPGDITTPTGGYAYARAVLARLPSFGIDVTHVVLPGTFPNPSAADLAATEQVLKATDPASLLLIDGLAYGVFPQPLIDRLQRPIVALCHHPLGFETGLSPERKAALLASERTALAAARHVIVSGAATGQSLQDDFAITRQRITVAEPGTDRAPRAVGTGGTGARVQVLAVGSVVPRKGYNVLIEAMARVSDLDWHLTIAGALDRDADAVRTVERLIATHGLVDRITLAGSVDPDELAALYHCTDVFVMASLYEGYGMVVTEAMVRGLAIVTTTCGAAVDALPASAALKVAVGDSAALAAAVRRAVGDPELRQSLADAAWRGAGQLPTWDDTSRWIATALKGVTA